MTPGRQSTLITALTRGARAATASTARCTTAITSAQVSPSITVNMASVWFGRQHGICLVRQAGITDHANRFGDDLADPLPHAQRGDGKRDQHRHTMSLPSPSDCIAGLAASRLVRVLVQRVSSAAVRVDGRVVGAIRPDGQGLVAFVGVTHGDDLDKARRLAEKLWNLRVLADEKSASDMHAPILVISQFTLYADTAKGRRPSWNAAAPGAVAQPLIAAFAAALRQLGAHVEAGVFGAHMQVELVNDGPVTVMLEG